jgi:hypothetical protein
VEQIGSTRIRTGAEGSRPFRPPVTLGSVLRVAAAAAQRRRRRRPPFVVNDRARRRPNQPPRGLGRRRSSLPISVLQRRLRRRSAHPCHGGRVPSPTDHDACPRLDPTSQHPASTTADTDAHPEVRRRGRFVKIHSASLDPSPPPASLPQAYFLCGVRFR